MPQRIGLKNETAISTKYSSIIQDRSDFHLFQIIVRFFKDRSICTVCILLAQNDLPMRMDITECQLLRPTFGTSMSNKRQNIQSLSKSRPTATLFLVLAHLTTHSLQLFDRLAIIAIPPLNLYIRSFNTQVHDLITSFYKNT